jgi:Protein of unknown function (DUF2911)
MKSVLFFALTLITLTACGQEDKSKRPSPPATAKETLNDGVNVLIDYSQPSIKGRTIGKDVEPMQGKAWRAGANEATVFAVDKNVQVEGKNLPAGKYSLFMVDNGNSWTIIFNSNWNIWGTQYDQNKSGDVLHVDVTPGEPASFAEKLTYTITKNGKVSLMWGNKQVDFMVK